MYLRDVTNPNSPVTYHLSPAWLTRSPSTLPTGWAFNAAAGAGRWVGLEDNESSVSVFVGDGSAHEFKKTSDGAYTAPLSAPNHLLSLGDEGRFILEDAGGTVYTFRSDGVLESLDTTTDDLNPAGLTYGYSGTPTRLRTISDPVSDRSVTLSYVGDAGECTTEPTQAAGLLCRVAFWDGTSTTLSYAYDTSPRLISITNPGTLTTQLGYDTSGRLDRVRDPLALETVRVGLRANDLSTLTQVAYDASGRVASVTQPSPTAGGLRPQRTYTYSPGSRIGEVDVAGFSPSTGYAQRVVYDVRNRITESRGSDGLASTYTWDALDRLVGTTDPAGLRTTTVYDHASRPVTSYGPAPASSFQANGLPVAGAQVPTTSKVYDGSISGLAAAYWSNPFLAGGPSLHDTGLGSGGEMYRDWGSAPPVAPGPGGWSSRYSGYLNAPTTGSYLFQVQTRGSRTRVWVDEVLVVDHARQPEPTGAFEGTVGAATTLSAGQHRIRVDHVDTSGPAGLEVSWQPPGAGSFTRLPGSALTPGYGLVTSMTDPDGRVTATEYTDTSAGIGPHHRLATATVEDPGGLALRTSITYETPGAGSYLRRVARTLPAGNTWTTLNYGGTEGPVAAVCGVPAGTPQGGQPRRITGPDPDGAGPGSARVEEFVYDAIGRPAGRRVTTLATLSGTGWQCSTFDTRGRLVTQSWPAHDGSPARTITHTFAVGGNPLVNQVSDTTTGKNVSATVDLLGRTVSYTDIWGATTTTVFDQPGRMTSATGPSGTTVWNFDAATGRATTTVLNGSTLATPSYNPTTGRLAQASYGNSTSGQWSYDAQGRASAIAITDQSGQTGETRAHSLGGRLVDQQVFQQGTGLVDANPRARTSRTTERAG